MQTATSETESTLLDLSICVHHYTLRAPCPKGQGKVNGHICPRPVRTAKPCHEIMQGTAEAVCCVLPSGMLCLTGSGARILLPHAFKRTSLRRSPCSLPFKASSTAAPAPLLLVSLALLSHSSCPRTW